MTSDTSSKPAPSGAGTSLPSYDDLAEAVLVLAAQRDEARSALAQALTLVSPGYARAGLHAAARGEAVPR